MSRMPKFHPLAVEPPQETTNSVIPRYLLWVLDLFFGKTGFFYIFSIPFLMIAAMVGCIFLMLAIDRVFIKPIEVIQKDEKLLPEKKYEFTEKARNNSILLAGVILSPIATVGVAWLTIRNSQKITSETLKLAYQGQLADRFNKSAELLADELTYNQVAGLHSLEQIALVDTGYRKTVCEVLAAFVQAKALNPWDKFPSGVDTESLLNNRTVIGQGYANRRASPIQMALLCVFHLRKLDKDDAETIGYVVLTGLDLSFVFFNDAFLANVVFDGSDLRRTVFGGGTFTNCSFGGADLSFAEFVNTSLDLVVFDGADISYTGFSTAKGLTWRQILSAKSSRGTKLPDYLLESPDRPAYFNRAHYDRYGWSNEPSK